MVSSKEFKVNKFAKVVYNCFEKKHLISKEPYSAKLEYVDVINYNTSTYWVFISFDVMHKPLDHYFGKYLNGCDRCKDLWKVIVLLFTFAIHL